MPLIPRDYQRKMLYDIRTAFHVGKNPLVVAPTGSGKMIVIAQLAYDLKCRVLIIEHRQELIDQAIEKLNLAGVAPGIIAANYKPKKDALIDKSPEAQIRVGMVQTLARRETLDYEPEVIVIDEAHLSQANSYLKLRKRWPNARACGLTATPERLDGKGFRPAFDTLIHGPSIPELIRLGYLCRVELYTAQVPDLSDVRIVQGDYDQMEVAQRLNNKKLVGDVVDQWRIHANGETTVVFATSIAHSQRICEAFVAAGVSAVHLDGSSPDAFRRETIEKLRNREIQVCCNCGILVEGVDVPGISCVILAMATQSISRYLQSIGRGMRPLDGKPKLTVLDHGGNYRIHGSPDAVRVWTLDGKPPREVVEKPEDLAEDALVWLPEQGEQSQVQDTQVQPHPQMGGANPRPLPVHIDGDLEFGPEGYLPLRRRRLMSQEYYERDYTPRRKLVSPAYPGAQPTQPPPQPAPQEPQVEMIPLRPGVQPPRPCPAWAKRAEAVWDAAEIERIRKGYPLSWSTVRCRLWLAGVRR